jgi:hypothetical protein
LQYLGFLFLRGIISKIYVTRAFRHLTGFADGTPLKWYRHLPLTEKGMPEFSNPSLSSQTCRPNTFYKLDSQIQCGMVQIDKFNQLLPRTRYRVPPLTNCRIAWCFSHQNGFFREFSADGEMLIEKNRRWENQADFLQRSVSTVSRSMSVLVLCFDNKSISPARFACSGSWNRLCPE